MVLYLLQKQMTQHNLEGNDNWQDDDSESLSTLPFDITHSFQGSSKTALRSTRPVDILSVSRCIKQSVPEIIQHFLIAQVPPVLIEAGHREVGLMAYVNDLQLIDLILQQDDGAG